MSVTLMLLLIGFFPGLAGGLLGGYKLGKWVTK